MISRDSYDFHIISRDSYVLKVTYVAHTLIDPRYFV